MLRFFRAFKKAFWTALHETASRHTRELNVTFHVDTKEATAHLRQLEDRLDVLAAKAEYTSNLMGRMH